MLLIVVLFALLILIFGIVLWVFGIKKRSQESTRKRGWLTTQLLGILLTIIGALPLVYLILCWALHIPSGIPTGIPNQHHVPSQMPVNIPNQS